MWCGIPVDIVLILGDDWVDLRVDFIFYSASFEVGMTRCDVLASHK